ncbi:hypothetical protein LC040_02170 [Bacillus tianshenii]|nr:hypothetical protein LC040_02170 [Bacillus tianshenii]
MSMYLQNLKLSEEDSRNIAIEIKTRKDRSVDYKNEVHDFVKECMKSKKIFSQKKEFINR